MNVLRKPTDTLAECLWLPRFTDKVRLHTAGQLTGDYLLAFCHPRGIDSSFLNHFAIEKDEAVKAIVACSGDGEVAEWFLSLPTVTHQTIAAWNTFAPQFGRPGQASEKVFKMMLERMLGNFIPDIPLESAFEAITWDESAERRGTFIDPS
jgi:hypothetical protein